MEWINIKKNLYEKYRSILRKIYMKNNDPHFYPIGDNQAIHKSCLRDKLHYHWQYTGSLREHYHRLYVFIGNHWHDQDILIIPVKDLWVKDCCEVRKYHFSKCTENCIYDCMVISNDVVDGINLPKAKEKPEILCNGKY